MNLANLAQAKDWFEVLQTTERTQTALMTLDAGGSSGEDLNSHPDSDQVLLVLDGEVEAQVADETSTLKKGDVLVIPKGVKHKISNPGKERAVTFTTYSPPAYPE